MQKSMQPRPLTLARRSDLLGGMAALVLSLAICCSLLVQTAVAVPLSQFYEFGPPLDQDLGPNDDISAGLIQLSRVFKVIPGNSEYRVIRNKLKSTPDISRSTRSWAARLHTQVGVLKGSCSMFLVWMCSQASWAVGLFS